jgi:hypothetical protein
LEFLVEEPSMEAFLRALLPRLLPKGTSFEVHAFQGKDDLLGKLEPRLRGYADWLPAQWRVIVLVDRDDDNCAELKQRMENAALRARLRSRTQRGNAVWQVVTRIAIEELEAWYFGDWEAVKACYPRVPENIPRRQGLRDPDAIAGGTWEAFERVLQQQGYFKGGLAKIQAARSIGAHIVPERSRSPSFRTFHAAVAEAVSV